MKSIQITVLSIFFFYSFSNPALAQSKKYFFSIGGEKHFSEEFNYAYAKNSFDTEIKKDSIDSYLTLYINFRLKVKEAKEAGYDTTKTFKEEFEVYKKQLQNSYISPKKEQEALVKEAYERSLWEIRASHILIRVTPEASPADTSRAFARIKAIRERALVGEDFAQLANELSEDPSAKMNAGDLGYFSVFQMVYPFETAAYTTPVGEVSQLFRTQFGYHIVHVVDKRPNEGKLKVAHIMIRATDKNAADVQANAKKKAFFIDSLLHTGAKWDSLCQQYSEDKNSVPQNGELKPFGRGQIVPAFEQAAYQLKTEGDISAPLKTQFGWHIIKLIETMPVGSYEDEKANLGRRIKGDIRSSMPRDEMLKSLKKSTGFYANKEQIAKLMQLPPSVIIKNEWQFDSALLANSTVLFSINEKKVTQGEFLKGIQHKPFRSGKNQQVEMQNRLKAFEDSMVVNYEKEHLPDKFPEYGFLLQEYYDGILLFSIMEDSVWNLAMKDSLGLEKFYKSHLQNYEQTKTDTVVYASTSKAVLEKITVSLSQPLNLSDWDRLNSKLLEENNVSPLTLQILSKEEVNKNRTIFNEQLENQIFELEDRWVLVKEIEVLQPTPLEEIKGKVISHYQSYLDKQWIITLRSKYHVKVNKKQLNKVYEHFKAID